MNELPLENSAAEFLGFNFEALAELIAFVDFSEGFTIAIAEINFAGDVDRVMDAVRRDPRIQDVDLVDLVLDDPKLESVLDAVRARLEQLTIREGLKPVLVVRGLEQAIGITGGLSVPVLQNLNYTREQFRSQVPCPLVLVLPRFAVQRLAAGSRDFWAWASAIIRFQSAAGSVSQARMDCYNGRIHSNDQLLVKQERLDLLLRLLEEYRPLVSEDQLLNAKARLEVLEELGDAFDSISDMRQASKYYQQFFALAEAVGDQNTQANGLFKIGRLYYRLDDRHQDALDNYDKAIVLYQSAKNRLGEANTLKAIGDVLQFLKQSQDALNRYETAIDIYRQVGDRLGEANTLKAIGDVLQFLKQSQDALNRYETAIDIYRQVGDRLGEANTLKAIGDVLQFLDQRQDALNRYETAIDIYRQVGDRLGEANTLKAIGDVLQFLDQRQKALDRYETAIEIYRQVGDRLGEANTLQAIGDLQSDFNLAIQTFFQTALKIYEQIGSQYSQGRILADSIAPTYLKLGNSYQAKTCYEEALKFWTNVNYTPGINQCKQALANLNQSSNNRRGPTAPKIGDDRTPREKKRSFPLWQSAIVLLVFGIGWLAVKPDTPAPQNGEVRQAK